MYMYMYANYRTSIAHKAPVLDGESKHVPESRRLSLFTVTYCCFIHSADSMVFFSFPLGK